MLIHEELEFAFRALLAPAVLATRWMIPGADHRYRDLPAVQPALALTVKMFLDELFFSTEIALAKVIALQECRRINAEVSAALELFEAQGWLSKPARYHGVPPELESPQLRREQCGHLRFQHLQFNSLYEPHPDEPGRARWLSYIPNRTAHAWVLEHRGRPRPWLICLPGYRMGMPRIDFMGLTTEWLHRRMGLNLVIPVLPFHGPRTVGRRSGDGFLCGDHLDTVHALAQAVWDIRRISSWVRRRDAPTVGAYGISLGGYIGALFASLNADLDCVITGMPAVDLVRLVRCHLPPLVLWLAERSGLLSADVERLMRVVSPLALVPQVPRERRYLFAGLVDRLVPPDHVREIWRHWERPRIAWYEGGHLWFLWAKEVRALIREALRSSGFLPAGRKKGSGLLLVKPARIAA